MCFGRGVEGPGNGVFTCTPYSGWAGTQISLEFLYGHGSLPDSRKREIDAACKDWSTTNSLSLSSVVSLETLWGVARAFVEVFPRHVLEANTTRGAHSAVRPFLRVVSQPL